MKKKCFLGLFVIILVLGSACHARKSNVDSGEEKTISSIAETAAPETSHHIEEVTISYVMIQISLDMVLIEGGSFEMGQKFEMWQEEYFSDDIAVPVRDITVSTFEISRTPITQEDFLKVMGYNPSYFNNNPAKDEIQVKRPVENVTWYDAVEFCNKLSEREGLNPVYSFSDDIIRGGHQNRQIINYATRRPLTVTADWNNNGYRLPTEAEWEYACRAGTDTLFYWGDDADDFLTAKENAWFIENSDEKTHQVGLKTANAFGLQDMSGNVNEWVWDWYGTYDENDLNDPQGSSSGSDRVLRGGSWGISTKGIQSATRSYLTPNARFGGLGFRVVRRQDL